MQNFFESLVMTCLLCNNNLHVHNISYDNQILIYFVTYINYCGVPEDREE